MDNKVNIEAKAADTILQEAREVKVGDKTYLAADPTCATLAKVSALIPELPKIDAKGNILNEVLAVAKDSGAIYQIAATLILGAKRIRQEQAATFGKGWIKKKPKSTFDTLVEELEYDCSPSELFSVVREMLAKMEIADFFALSVSLSEIGLIQRKRETEETTASGPR